MLQTDENVNENWDVTTDHNDCLKSAEKKKANQGEEPNKLFYQCCEKDCQNISYESPDGHFCKTCTTWVCVSCCKHDTYYSKKNPTYYCSACYDVLMIGRHPRITFEPDQPVFIETQFLQPPKPPPLSKRQKIQPQQSDKEKKTTSVVPTSSCSSSSSSSFALFPPPLRLDENKTLLEIAFMEWPDIKPTMLAQRNKHPLDDTVWLDETEDKHLYGVQFAPGKEFESDFIQSTSSMYHMYFPSTYNQLEAIRAMLNGKNWGPYHPKYGKEYFSTDETQQVNHLFRLLCDWKQNGINKIQIGKFVHFILECVANNQLSFVNDYAFYLNFAHFQQFVQWHKQYFDPHYEPYRTEMRFRSCEIYRRVGTCDLLATFKNQLPPEQCDGILRIVMFDWKNCIIKHTGFDQNDKGILECADLPKCNKREYELQQADYEKLATQQIYEGGWMYKGKLYQKVQFVARYLVAFDESNVNNEANMVPLEDQQHRLTNIWKARAIQVQEWEAKGRPVSKPHKEKEKDLLEEEEQTKAKLLDIIREVKAKKSIIPQAKKRLR